MEDDCIFCKIVAGQIPSYKVYEDEDFLAFFDITQFTEGHTLVIPKQHFHYVWDVTNIGNYYEVVQKIAKYYKEKLGFAYVDSLVFGRNVAHAHIHLVPHNGENVEWEKALEGLEYFFKDQSRKLTPENGNILVEKFKLP